jgi:hypothetical protein
MIQACEDDFAAEAAEDSMYASPIGGEQTFIAGLRAKTAAGSFLTWHERARLAAAYNLMNATGHEDRMQQSLILSAMRALVDCQTIWLQRRDHEQSETVTTTDVLRFVRERIREAGGSPEQADGIRVGVNPTDPTVVDITIPMSPVTVYSAVILAKTPEATERVVDVLREDGYDVSSAHPSVGGREAVEATLARVRQGRELDVSPEAAAAGKCCHKETPGCYCAVGFPYDEMCPVCRDQPNRYVFTRCDC